MAGGLRLYISIEYDTMINHLKLQNIQVVIRNEVCGSQCKQNTSYNKKCQVYKDVTLNAKEIHQTGIDHDCLGQVSSKEGHM